MVNLGLIALFSNFKLTNSSEKHLEDISHALFVSFVSLMFKLINIAYDSDELSIGFYRDRRRR